MEQASNGNSREDLAELVDVDAMTVARLTREMREAAQSMERREARFLVDAYYQIQESRQRHSNQRTAGYGEDEPPYMLVDWLAAHTASIELRLANLLKAYANGNPVGVWSQTICGIGPIIAAGLLAYIDITRAPTVGHIWRYAGLDPTHTWLGKEGAKKLVREHLGGREKGPVTFEEIAKVANAVNRKPENVLALMERPTQSGAVRPQTVATLVSVLAAQPWCANLKTLCWKIGESFVKVSGRDADIYGHLYIERKLREQALNEAGMYADQAARALATKNYKRGNADDDEDEERSWKTCAEWYEQGKLPPAHIHARAKRWAVKLFLAHWHEVRFVHEYDVLPPKPYILTEAGGHSHKIEVPNWPDWAKHLKP